MGENSNFSEAELSVFRSLFDSWDGNKNGVIEKEEIGDVLRAAGQDPTNAELDGFMERADTDKNGVVDFQEFVNMIDEVKKNTPKETLLQEAFKSFDINSDGKVSSKELKEFLQGYGEKLTDQEAEEIIKLGDVDGDGMLNVDEFIRALQEFD
ncbi:neo-calmodulin-like [Convolutriloba macropyga]|uniref:neo-calmodulin-like n=1 Tax=Convolutriloba macropyga TaxID=536237 RepID=UPI003F51F99C